MTLYKRTSSAFWWYDFTLNGQRYQGSTQEPSKPKARRSNGSAGLRYSNRPGMASFQE